MAPTQYALDVFTQIIYREIPNFKADAATRQLYSSIFAWLWRIDDAYWAEHDVFYEKWNHLGLNYDKGIWLYGDMGTGKSSAMRVMQKYMNHMRDAWHIDDPRLGFSLYSAASIANTFACDGDAGLRKFFGKAYIENNLCIDELGREPIPAKHYGNTLNVIEHVLQCRYDNKRSCFTHLTSNVQPADIAKLYGNYIADRFKELFNIVPLMGTSNRH